MVAVALGAASSLVVSFETPAEVLPEVADREVESTACRGPGVPAAFGVHTCLIHLN
jgi:hypothetical protein